MSRTHITLALKFLVSGGLIWFLVGGIDLGAASERILVADLKILTVVVGLSLLQVVICVLR